LKSLEGVDRALLRAGAVELNKLERRVGFLATTASITPFIGLFGTVWGIMTAFRPSAPRGRRTSRSWRRASPRRSSRRRRACSRRFRPCTSTTTSRTNVKHFAGEMDDFALEFLNIASATSL
jgi:biopolymer transport protein TolQ